jgi:hypothetical protein
VADLPEQAGGGGTGAGLVLSNKVIAANVQSVLAQQPGVSGAGVEEVTQMLENATIGNIKLLDLLPYVARGALKPALKEMCIVCGLEDGGLVEELKSRLLSARVLLRDGRNVGPAGAGEMHPPAPDVPDQGSDEEEGASSRPKAKHLARGRAPTREEGLQGSGERTAALRKKEDAKKVKAGEVVDPCLLLHPVSKCLTLTERRDLCDKQHFLRCAQNRFSFEALKAGSADKVLKSGEEYDAWCDLVARIEVAYSVGEQEEICGKDKVGTLHTRFRRVLFAWSMGKVTSGYDPRERMRWGNGGL